MAQGSKRERASSIRGTGSIADEHFSTRGLLGRLAERGLPVGSLTEVEGRRHASVLAEWGGELGDLLTPVVTGFAAEAVLVPGGIAGLYPLFGPALAKRPPVPALSGELGPHAPLLGAAGG